MLEIGQSPANVLALKLTGTIEKRDIQGVEEAMKEKLAANDRIGVVVDMSQCTDMTADAIVEDLKAELSLIDQWHRFPRVALVSDKQFLKALTRFFDPLVPSVDFANFASDDYDKAVQYASQVAITSDAATRH